MNTELEFLDYILKNLVKNPNGVSIEKTEDELGILLTIKIDKEDMGIIIGKAGNTINSIRSLLRIFGTKIDKKVNIKVLD